jgi:SRSO17 transposase
MTKDLVQAIGPEFTAFLRPFERFFDNPGTVQHFRNYTRGLLTDLDRKTAEPLAKYAGTPARCLQQFLKACLWDHDGLTDGVQQALHAAVAELPPDPVGTVCILDETSALKQGTKTPGVQRQYLGCAGKVANGIVTVHLVVTHGPFKALLDSELFLPESWDADRERCREADIPDEVRYRSKWEIGLELLARTERNGWQFDWLTFDEWYGGKPGFPRVLDVAALRYVREVPKTFSCRPGRSQTAMSAEAVFSQPGVKKRAAKSFRFEHQTGPGRRRSWTWLWGPTVGRDADWSWHGIGRRGRRNTSSPTHHGGSPCGVCSWPRSCAGMWNMCSASPRAKSA